MQYDGFVVGPGIRALRKKSTYTLEALSKKTALVFPISRELNRVTEILA